MISNKCFYALKAMLELAKREGSGPVPIADIAREQRIPTRFLEAILRQLKQSGLTDSARGKEGGYFLARPAKTIRVGQVIRLFEGQLIAVSLAAANEKPGQMSDGVFAGLWKNAETALASVFDSVSFAELAAQEQEAARHFIANYAI